MLALEFNYILGRRVYEFLVVCGRVAFVLSGGISEVSECECVSILVFLNMDYRGPRTEGSTVYCHPSTCSLPYLI